MQAELTRAGVYVGVVILNEDGTVTAGLEDPAEKEHVEWVFREAGPLEYSAGYVEAEDPWQESSQFGNRQWFEKVLSGLGSQGYTFHLTKTDDG
jgi:hypothetical protein